ncbi:MBL fold metallo-hydrolase [Alkalibacterium sp. f15]|uniref:MBL fold metallo-hydrolase n=1 Tax=Alkalibacterium sp. f15 TaxID=3414029 RepID=UPI003BF7BC41
MKVTVLGFYGGYPTKGIGTSAYLIESNGFHLLLDVGSNSLLTLERYVDPIHLDAVLLSHYHHDHIADLGVLQFTRLLKRDAKGNKPHLLPIYCHNEDIDNFKQMSFENVTLGIAYNEESELTIGPFKIEHMKTLHPVPCYAFKITEEKSNKTIVSTSDSGYKEAFIAFAKDADLLIADSNFYEGMENHTVHMTAKECGRIANKAKVKRLILTHLPQTGELNQLVEQAKNEAPSIPIELAQKEMTITI